MRRATKLAWLTTALFVSLTACGASQGAPSPPPGPPAMGTGTIVLVRGNDLWTMTADGSHSVQLTHEGDQNFANNPAFSPDGSQIAYALHISPSGDNWGGAELHMMAVNGTSDRTLIAAKGKGERAENPAWSADGQAIYYAHDLPIFDANKYTGDTLSVDRVGVATGKGQVVVKGAIYPTTSRSGSLAWVTYDVNTSAFQLQVGAADGSNGHTVLTEKDFQGIYSPRLSPDGTTLVFAGSGRTSSKVASVGVGTRLAAALNPLLPSSAEAHGLPWDPWVIDVDGSGFKKIMNLGSDEQALTWSPDGHDIAMANLSSTYLMRADGGGVHRIVDRGDPGGLDWKGA